MTEIDPLQSSYMDLRFILHLLTDAGGVAIKDDNGELQYVPVLVRAKSGKVPKGKHLHEAYITEKGWADPADNKTHPVTYVGWDEGDKDEDDWDWGKVQIRNDILDK